MSSHLHHGTAKALILLLTHIKSSLYWNPLVLHTVYNKLYCNAVLWYCMYLACQIHFRCILVTASYGHYGQHIATIGPDCICLSDFLHLIQFRSSKEGLDHTVHNWLGSDMDGLVRFWPNTRFGPETSWCTWSPCLVVAEHNWSTTSFPL